MKRIAISFAAIAALLLTACHNDEAQPAEGMGTINFQVINYEQISLDEVTRAAATSLAHLEMAIYDATSHELIDSVKTTSSDANYGSFSATLPFGEYTVVFLGFDGSKASHLKNFNQIGFADNYVPNFFYKKLDLTVSEKSSGNQNISLARKVAAFSIKSEGYIPSNLSTMTIVARGGGFIFNAETGQASAVAQKTSTYNVASYAGKESIGINVYTFLPSEETTMNFTVTATDSNGEVIVSKEFADVPMKINQRTIYTGSLFGDGTSTNGFDLSLENDAWEEVNNTY
ncbi:MAG: FimB/Mfa2 family fimbrial subunit [Bacteroidaceae bacterium]|nr:FimB/Mfa2 family fimbrial subunit [Bacteroidaceae bacterium]